MKDIFSQRVVKYFTYLIIYLKDTYVVNSALGTYFSLDWYEKSINTH